MTEPQLTPAQRDLMNFLDKLASFPYSPELMREGYQALDAAVEENERLIDSINGASSALATAKKCAELDGKQES